MSVKVFLKPGELYIGKEPAVVSNILGSCVSITMFSERLGAGGICHALLPRKFAFRNDNMIFIMWTNQYRTWLENSRKWGPTQVSWK
jgi:chemotaxis receptor (MCP) glutamine deamidase CheD